MVSKNKLKEDLYAQCIHFMNNRLNVVSNQIENIQQSLTSETKSSAGDKHETGRAMLQLDREKAGQQLLEIQKTIAVLHKINLNNTSKNVSLGSLVYTSQANYFICISAGALKSDVHAFFAIAPNTPIGLLLMGKTVGDRVNFKGTTIAIEKLG